MIELKNVSKFYKTQTISIGLKNINLKLSKNEIVAITGPSGAGKSTLLNVICGMDSYDEGEIYFKGNDISYFNEYDRDIFRKQNVALISQNYNLINSYTALDNLLVPLLINGLDAKVARKKAMEYIERVGLSSKYKSKVMKLSGGEKQRLCIARALATECDILACDEPTGNLDSNTGKQIIELIKEVAKDKLVIIVTHNYAEIENIATRTLIIKDGEIIDDIIKKDINDDIKEPLNLTNTKITKKNLATLVFKNIKGTPRKSFFIAIVYTIISCAFLFLILSCLAMRDENMYTPNENYRNNIYNRIIVFDKEHKPLDINKLSKIEGKKFVNAFYEDILINLKLSSDILGSINYNQKFSGLISYYVPDDFVLIEGDYPKTSGDFMLIFNYDKVDNYKKIFGNKIGSKMAFEYYPLADEELNFCGYGYSQQVTNDQFVPYTDYSKELTGLYYSNVNIKYVKNGELLPVDLQYTFREEGQNLIEYYGPKDVDISSLIINLSGLYDIEVSQFEVKKHIDPEYIEKVVASIYLPLEMKDVYEVVIYPKDMNKALKMISATGYSIATPGRNGVNKKSNDYIKYLEFVLITIVAIIVLSLISFFIITRILESKNKEYVILRMLGVIGSDLKKLIIMSSILITIVTSIMVLLIFIIGSLFKNSIFMVMKYNNPIVVLCFFIYLLMMAIVIGVKVSRKTKNLNLSSTLKSEV